jgi:hypothetical protein
VGGNKSNGEARLKGRKIMRDMLVYYYEEVLRLRKKLANNEKLDYYEEVLLLRKKVEKYETILKHAMSEKTGAFFICGEAGEKDSMGLPEKIMICPTYGLDGFASYKKDRDYDAPGW